MEARFFEQIEKFKADIRERESAIERQFSAKEREVDRIANYLFSEQQARNTVAATKRIEAAETLLAKCHILQRQQFTVETMKLVDVTAVQEKLDKNEMSPFFKQIEEMTGADSALTELKEINHAVCALHLSDRSVKLFDAYLSVFVSAIAWVKLAGLGMPPAKYFNADGMAKAIIPVLPYTEKSFEKHGPAFGFFCADTLYQELVQSLRSDIDGKEAEKRVQSTALRYTLESQQIHVEARQKLKELGLPDDLTRDQPLVNV